MSSIRKFDAYAKTLDDFRIKTDSGGIVTLISGVVIIVLLISEWRVFVQPNLQSQLDVDSGRKERMEIYINVTFPYLPCAIMSLDVMDVAGDHQNEISHNVYKVRLDSKGNRIDVEPVKESVSETLKGNSTLPGPSDAKYCGSCYGAKEGCCNTCKSVEEAYFIKKWSFKDAGSMEQCIRDGYVQAMKEQSTEGCMFHGHFSVNKVPGNFHFAPGRSYEQSHFHIHDISSIPSRNFDFSHYIESLTFGNKVPGMVSPLSNVRRDFEPEKMFMIQNYIKVVGTTYKYLNGIVEITNQYSVTEFVRDVTEEMTRLQNTIPGLFFHYDISPMVITQTETRKSWTYFLTSLCAVVGGVFTVAGLIDAALYRASRTLLQKRELGKTR